MTTNIEALTILHNLVEQLQLTGKDRDQARAIFARLAEFIQKAEAAPVPEEHG